MDRPVRRGQAEKQQVMLGRLTIAAHAANAGRQPHPGRARQPGDKVIERLHPRLESAPEVLFAAGDQHVEY
jgi:hypothetical protein